MQKTVQKVMSSGVIALSLVMADFSYADNLDIVVKSAPIVPDGLIAGKPLDVTFSFVDLNPEVPGMQFWWFLKRLASKPAAAAEHY